MQKQRLSLYEKAIKRFFGIKQLDEYKLRKVEHIGTLMFMINTFLLLISTLIASILATMNFNSLHILIVLTGFNFGFFMLEMLILIIYNIRYRLDRVEVDVRETKQTYKKVIRSEIKSGLIFGIWMYLWSGFMDHLSDGISWHLAFLSIIPIVMAILEAVFFGIFITIYKILRIKKNEIIKLKTI